MCTAPSNPARRTDMPLPKSTLLLAALLWSVPALATTTDRNQKINVSADHFESSQRSGKTILTGHVSITQGTLKATAGKGVAHADNQGKAERIVLTGAPAHLEQRMDNGELMRAHADTIDYQVNGEIIKLTGNAHVNQPGQGTFNGASLVYNPKTGAIKGSGGKQGRVHLTLEPRKKDAD